MSRTVQVARPKQTKEEKKPPVRRTRVVLKKVGPWSVFKFALLYYFCVMIVILVALTLLYNLMGALGVLDDLAGLIKELGFGSAKGGFEIDGGWLLTRVFAIGVVMVVFCALVKMFLIFLYNLISELVGGVEVTLTERR